MRIDIATLFPAMCESVMGESIIGRARKAGALEVHCHHIRDHTLNKHRNVDDVPCGHGKGMLLAADPLYRCWEAIVAEAGSKPHVVYMTPKGQLLTQQRAIEIAQLEHVCILCGHYEGVDQRLIDEIVDEELSIGDYVLTGGELPALVLADCISRMVPGVLADESCWRDDSHVNSLLEYPHYTRPIEWHGRKVPEVLLGGHQAKIDRWRRDRSLELTALRRPELLESVALDDEDRRLLGLLEDVQSGAVPDVLRSDQVPGGNTHKAIAERAWRQRALETVARVCPALLEQAALAEQDRTFLETLDV